MLGTESLRLDDGKAPAIASGRVAPNPDPGLLISEGRHGDLANIGVSIEAGLDLTQFDPIAGVSLGAVL